MTPEMMAAGIAATEAEETRAGWRAWYLVGVLTLLEVVSFVDRGALSLLVGPVKADLGLTDTEMSLLLGLSVAVFYSSMGIPIGWLIDRFSRRGIVLGGALLWTVMTMACGLARNFGQLFLGRMGVGLGDAALTPTGYSIIRDAFPPESRGRAYAVFQLGGAFGTGASNLAVGSLIGLAGAGGLARVPVIGGMHAWQAVLVLIGAAGIPLALLMLTTGEPRRRAETEPAARASSFGTALAVMRARWPFYTALAAMNVSMGIGLFGTIVWLPEAIARRWAIGTAQVGLTLGAIQGLGSLLGFLVAGIAIDRFARRGSAGFAPLSGGVVALISAAAMGLALLVPSILAMWALIALAWLGLCWATLVFPVTLAHVTPNRMMGKLTALYNVLASVVGIGLGATLVALISDRLFSGPQALGHALSLVAGTMLAINGLAQFAAARAMRGIRGRD